MTVPVSTCDREYDLMCGLVDRRVLGPEFDPQRQVLDLLAALGELSRTLNASDAGPGRWAHARNDLHTVITVAVDLAAYFQLPPYVGTTWPDGTRIGGDGAYRTMHNPHHLLAELIEAAGWVAQWVPAHRQSATTGSRQWQDTEPITELIARTWSLADRLNLRDTLRAALHAQMTTPS
jgi:hypothetical protein